MPGHSVWVFGYQWWGGVWVSVEEVPWGLQSQAEAATSLPTWWEKMVHFQTVKREMN